MAGAAMVCPRTRPRTRRERAGPEGPRPLRTPEIFWFSINSPRIGRIERCQDQNAPSLCRQRVLPPPRRLRWYDGKRIEAARLFAKLAGPAEVWMELQMTSQGAARCLIDSLDALGDAQTGQALA